MIDKLTFSQRGHTILPGNTGLGVLNRLLALGKLCECAEDSIVDNSITEPRKKEKWHILNGIYSDVLKAIHNMEPSEYFPAQF